MHVQKRHRPSREYLLLEMRNFIFGAEDSLVSTVGLVSGIATAGMGRGNILMTGSVLIFVEAFSMAVGSYLTERATHERTTSHGKRLRRILIGSGIMLVSYFGAGFVPLFPYVLFEPGIALYISIFCSMVALFGLGMVSAEVLKTNILRNSIRMVVLGGIAIMLGVLIGSQFS